MVYASLRTDPEDKGPDVMILMPRELATFVGISRDAAGDNCLYDAYVLGGEGLELEGTAEGLAHGAIRILMGLAGNSREWRSQILAAYMRGISMATAELVEREVFDMAMDILEEEKSDG
jgi:hypothetical protein